MKFIAWYCHKCKMYLREPELLKGRRCPECRGSTIPRPMETKELESGTPRYFQQSPQGLGNEEHINK